MGIPDEDVARVRAATDIVALIGEHAALKRQGRRWVGLCPFHSEKSPSFSVNAEEGFYYCFGCQAKGDAITFLRAVEHLDFVDAVRRLADKSGITIHEDANASRDTQRRKILTDAMERATEWYHQRLLTSADAGQARDYLRSRGYDGEVVRRFRLGWAPDSWDALCTSLGLSEQVAVGAGLGFVNRRGRLQDAFRGRVLFPICDPSGRPVALGGRVLPGSTDPAKYKNSQETPIYAKRRVLYALNWAKHDVISSGEVVVCEGYTDVIGFFQAGVERAVATCGTALADEHFRLLRNFAKRVVLAFDADGAGQSAAGRFYEWERRHEVDVAVASLPPGADPADLARTDPGALRAAVEGAKPFLQFRVERVLDAADLSTPEARTKAVDAALEAVAEHPDDLVRDQYVMMVAGRTGFEPAPLRERLDRIRRDGPRHPPAGGGRQTGSGGDRRDQRDDGRSPGGDRRGGGRTGGPGSTGGQGRGSAPGSEPWVRDQEGEGGDDGSPASYDSYDDFDGEPFPGGPGDPEWGSEGQGAGRGRNAAGNGAGRNGDGAFRPGLEALRLAIHRPDEVAHRLEAALFHDELQRAAFVVLVEADDLHRAVDEAPPDVRALLVRLTVEEPVGDPAEVVLQLVREVSRRELARTARQARSSPETVPEASALAAEVAKWVHELDDPVASADALDRLVAWLVGRDQEPMAGG